MSDDALLPLIEAVVRRLPEVLARHPKLREQLREALADDLVDQHRLPPTVPARAYLAACRAGKVPGAVKRQRRWVAPRSSVVSWWLADRASEGTGDPAIEALRAAGYFVDLERVPRVAPRQRK